MQTPSGGGDGSESFSAAGYVNDDARVSPPKGLQWPPNAPPPHRTNPTPPPMKDNVVAPTLLHHPGRVGRLIQALRRRSERTRSELARLAETHDVGQLDLERQLSNQLQSLQNDCVADRQTILRRWDDAQEKAIGSYEQVTIEVRDKLRRVAATSRRRLEEGIETVEKKVRLRIEAVEGQYNARKDAPAENAKNDLRNLGESLRSLEPTLQWTRDLTIRRLNRLLDIRLADDPMAEFSEVPPNTVRDAVSLIDRQRSRLEQTAAAMNQGFAAKTTDSFYLPAGVAVFVAIWTLVVLMTDAQPRTTWLIAGVGVAFLLGLSIYAALLWPLRRSTRFDHPRAERTYKVAELAASRGRAIAKRNAAWATAELEKRRAEHLAEADRWQKEQIEQLRTTLADDARVRESKLHQRLVELDQQFRNGHQQLTETMTEQLRHTDETIQQRLEGGSQHADTQMLSVRQQQALDRQRLVRRWHSGCERAAQWIVKSDRLARRRFPIWAKALSHSAPPADHVDFIPIGAIQLGDDFQTLREEAQAAFEADAVARPTSSPSLAGLSAASLSAFPATEDPPPPMGVLGEAMSGGLSADGSLSIGELVHASATAGASGSRLTVPMRSGSALLSSNGQAPKPKKVSRRRPAVAGELVQAVPLVLHRRVHSGLMIETTPARRDEAVGMAHQVMWRLLHAIRPGGVRLTLIDPVGRGQNFASFMALADHDPDLIHHRVWSAGDQITAQLARLDAHVQELIQSSLRDRYVYLEDYNAQAGSLAEPYHIVAAVGFPEALSRESYEHLQALIESGARCGVFVVLVIERGRRWPAGLSRFDSDRLLHLVFGGPGVGQNDAPVEDETSDQRSAWRCLTGGLGQYEVRMTPPPAADVRGAIARRVGVGSAKAASVVLPLDGILDSAERWTPKADRPTESTATSLTIPLGSRGGGRNTFLELGAGVRQHVLIAGKTGSGKSTLLHTMLLAGAACYRPDQLHFYLLDFKKGVEFQVYARHRLPHARVIGIETEREFGRSVLRRLDEEMVSRGEAFRQAGASSLADYLKSESRPSADPMPRILLVIDEFQELFTRDDALAADCTAMLDRLVRQGRSFGIHVVLASQSLSGNHCLPRATLGQMAVRVALQCGEGDAALVLDPDNAAARLLRRPGEAVYNDAGGAVEGNQPFQIATVPPEEHRHWIESICRRDADAAATLPAAVIFDGNRPVRFRQEVIEQVLAMAGPEDRLIGWVGEPVAIGPPAVVRLTAEGGRNVLICGPIKRRAETIASMLLTFAASPRPVEVIWLDGSRERLVDGQSDGYVDGHEVAPEGEGSLAEILTAGLLPVTPVTPAGAVAQLQTLVDQIDQSPAGSNRPTHVLLIDRLQRFGTLQQADAYNFSLDGAGGSSGAELFQKVLREGPAAGIHTIVSTTSSEILHRWLPRGSVADLQIRIVGRISEAESSVLIDRPDAGHLTTATVLLHDTADGSTTPLRVVEMPPLSQLTAPATAAMSD